MYKKKENQIPQKCSVSSGNSMHLLEPGMANITDT